MLPRISTVLLLVSLLLLLLLLAAMTTAFLPSRPIQTSKKRRIHSQKDDFLPLTVLLHSSKNQDNDAEAAAQLTSYLSDIVEAAKEARDYLSDLEFFAKVIRSYLERLESPADSETQQQQASPTTKPPPLPDLPNFKDQTEAQEYLVNIERSLATEQKNLKYLRDIADDARFRVQTKLVQFDGIDMPATGDATRAVDFLDDWEDKVSASEKYVAYLNHVARSVREYLSDRGYEELPRRVSTVRETPPARQRTTTVAAAAAGGDWNAAPANVAARATSPRASWSAPVPASHAVPSVPAPPAAGDYMSSLGGGGPVTKAPVRGKPKVPSKSTGYLDSMGSPPSTPAWEAATPAASATPAWSASDAPAASSPHGSGDYMSHLGGGATVKKAPVRCKPKVPTKSTGYLDGIGAAPPPPSWGAAPFSAPAEPADTSWLTQTSPATSATPAPPASGDYMSRLGGGTPVKKVVRGTPKVPTKFSGYLDSIGSTSPTTAWESGASSSTAPIAPASPSWSAPATHLQTSLASTASPAPRAGGDYMSSLGGGAPVKKVPVRGKPKVPTESTGYLESIGSVPSISSWGARATTVPSAPAWSAPAAIVAPTLPAGGDYMKSLGGAPAKKAPVRGKPKVPSKTTGYLDSMGSTPSEPSWGAKAKSSFSAPAWSAPASSPAPPPGGDYMSSLGRSVPVKKAVRGKPKVPTKSTGYLENMTSTPSTPSWGEGVSAVPTAAASLSWSDPSSTAPAPPAGVDYMSQLGAGAPVKKMPVQGKPKVATKSMSYLDSMTSTQSARIGEATFDSKLMDWSIATHDSSLLGQGDDVSDTFRVVVASEVKRSTGTVGPNAADALLR